VDASEYARWWHISPTGTRAVSEARGDIWTLPAEHNSPRNLAHTSGAYCIETICQGVPVDTAKDPWAAFQGMAWQTITITVSKNPVFDDAARDVIVEPLNGEGTLRFRQ